MTKWPNDNQKELIAFYGQPKTREMESQLVKVIPPFTMYYEGKPISGITFHKKAAPYLKAALDEIWDKCNHNQVEIDHLGLSEYCGAYNPRMIRGSSTKWSNHAFAAAIDLFCSQNGFNTGRGKMPQIAIDAFKRQGARWGGDYKHRTDPMHFEFCCGERPPRPIVLGATEAHSTQEKLVPVTHKGLDTLHQTMGEFIFDHEARLDNNGHLTVYTLPANNMGTKYEIAGITDNNHPEKFKELKALLSAKRYTEAKQLVIEYYMQYTTVVTSWHSNPGIEFFLRDCCINRGSTGAARILQHAVGVTDDGIVGNKTRAAIHRQSDINMLLKALREAREAYERKVFGYRSQYWLGLTHRWNDAYNLANKLNAMSDADIDK